MHPRLVLCSVSAILSSAGAPEILSVILEGECLFNDASSLTLFEIFVHLIESKQDRSLGEQIGDIAIGVLWSAFTGTCIGLACEWDEITSTLAGRFIGLA